MTVNDLEALFLLHSDMPRQGPGSDACTRAALRRLPPLPSSLRVFDLGCGPGAQTLVLAKHFQSPIIAVDIHGPYLRQLRTAAEAAELGDYVVTRQGRMEDLNETPQSINLIWMEGAIYLIGFEAGLRMFRPMLCDGGLLVASEITWLTDAPPDEARAYWKAAYPAMTTVEGNKQRARDAGYEMLDHFALPSSAWWDEFYTPLQERVALLRPQATADSTLARVLDEAEREMEIHKRFADTYSYVFYIMWKA